MQSLRSSILSYVRVRVSLKDMVCPEMPSLLNPLSQRFCTASASTGTSHDQIMKRVINLVKKFDKIDSAKVSERADFQKDLSLDSLDRVELVMAFEQEFSIEIPDEEADKFKCCADVANYISLAHHKVADNS